jgi:hypothetical protein
MGRPMESRQRGILVLGVLLLAAVLSAGPLRHA